MGITSAFSVNAGGAINPVRQLCIKPVKYSFLRDLGPRLFGAFVYGWNDVFVTHNYFFWVPIIGPIVGAILGV